MLKRLFLAGLLLVSAALVLGTADPQILIVATSKIPNTLASSPGAGSYGSTQSVTFTANNSDTIWYATSVGSPACGAGTQYTGAISTASTTTYYVTACSASGNAITGSFAYTISAGGTPTFNQAGQCNTGGYSCTIALTVTAGHIIWAGMSSHGSAATLSIADARTSCSSPCDTWATANTFLGDATGTTNNSQTFYTTVSASGSGATTITCTTSDNTNYFVCNAVDISGVTTLDKTAGYVNGTSTTPVTGTTATTTAANEILLCFFGNGNAPSNGWTQGTNWTIPTNGSQTGSYYSSAVEYQVVSSTGSYQGTITTVLSYPWIGMISTFK